MARLHNEIAPEKTLWPRIARYHETISAIPPYCALWGFWCLNMATWVRYPLPPFLSVSPLESMRSGGAIPPPPLKRGISAILARYPMKTRVRYPPSAILSRKGSARYGGVSRTGPLSEKMLNRYEKGFEKRRKRSEKRSETCAKHLRPPHAA